MKIEKLKTVFIHIPKAAGTSIEHFFINTFLKKEFFEKQDFEDYVNTWPDLLEESYNKPNKRKFGKSHFKHSHSKENRYSKKTEEKYYLGHTIIEQQGDMIIEHLGHMMIEEYAKRNENDFVKYFKFSIVRNPWDRLVSLYSFIPTVNSPLTNSYQESCKAGFEEFVKYVKNNNLHISNDPKDILFRRQIDFLTDKDGNLMVDYVGKFENLQKDFDVICKSIGIKAGSLPHTHKTNRKSYTEYYDNETRDIVSEIYKEDIEKFEYSFI